MKQNHHKGKVVIAGAGPGDPDLITIKVARYLSLADVILADRLVSRKILDTYANSYAKIIYVGKQRRRAASTSQTAINALMVKFARENKLVLRLKGGDVSVFSNILEELKTLVDQNISYEIIPGISAASGAAAYTGIPLTARGYSNAIRFLTYYKTDIISEEYWKELAQTDDTLVFYMSSEILDEIVSKMIQNKVESEKLLAVIEQATTPWQSVHIFNLYEYEASPKGVKFLSPSLIIIGKVVSLFEQFSWLKNNNNNKQQYYFTPISGSVKKLIISNKVVAHAGRA